MACEKCIRALEQGALVLFELSYLHGEELPPGTDWRGVASQLQDLSIALRRSHNTQGNHDGRDTKEVDGSAAEVSQ